MAAMITPLLRRRLVRLVLVAILPLALVTQLSALDRLQRRLGPEDGLTFSEVTTVAQDEAGFIWIGTTGGVFRFDGTEVRRWDEAGFRTTVNSIVTSPSGQVAITAWPFRLWEVLGNRIVPVSGPDGQPLELAAASVWDGGGRLWAPLEDRLLVRDAGGVWATIPLEAIDSEPPLWLADAAPGILIATERGLWLFDESLDAHRLVSLPGIHRARAATGGSYCLLMEDGRVLRLTDGRLVELFRSAARPIDLTVRGTTIWVSYDSQLVTIPPGTPPMILTAPEGIASGGQMLVDREGSLWVSTFRGLLQFPEPDTVAWQRTDGMASTDPRRLVESPDGIWVDSWTGLTHLTGSGRAWSPEAVPDTLTSAICVSSGMTFRAGYRGRYLEGHERRLVSQPEPALRSLRDCAAGAAGRVWMISISVWPSRRIRRDAPEARCARTARPVLPRRRTGESSKTRGAACGCRSTRRFAPPMPRRWRHPEPVIGHVIPPPDPAPSSI